MSFENYRQGYLDLYKSLKIKSDFEDDLQLVRRKILNQKYLYQDVAAKFNIPWIFFAVKHFKEASLRPDRQILNGQRWDQTTTIVPKGRGPFSSWQEAAIDSTLYMGYHKVKDWSIDRILYELERHNGFGYRKRNINTPYLWAGCQHYSKGGYPRDGFFDPNHVIKNVGCAVIIRHFHILGIDTGIQVLGTVMDKPQEPVTPLPITEPKELQMPKVKPSPKPRLHSWLSQFLRYIKVSR